MRGFECFDRLHVEGGIGGYPIPQYRKKNWEIPKFDEIPIPHVWLVTFSTCLPRQACMHQKSTSDIARKHEKTLNWSVQWLKSPVITIKSKVFKILTYINLFSLLWFMLHILSTRSIREESANDWHRNTVKDILLPNTVNKKDETLHTPGLDDTAIPHIKIKITEIPLEKQLTAIPQYRKPPCTPPCCLTSSGLICIITIIRV